MFTKEGLILQFSYFIFPSLIKMVKRSDISANKHQLKWMNTQNNHVFKQLISTKPLTHGASHACDTVQFTQTKFVSGIKVRYQQFSLYLNTMLFKVMNRSLASQQIPYVSQSLLSRCIGAACCIQELLNRCRCMLTCPVFNTIILRQLLVSPCISAIVRILSYSCF